MTIQAGVIQGTAKEIRAALDAMSDDEVVRLMVGRPSLSVIARKLQNEVAKRGMTDAQYDELMASLKND
jgi:arginine repressor